MNIKQIETFVRIVELGSFHAAADVLCASPSTVSARIKELERYLGAELFDRSFHRAQPSAQGLAFYAHARELVAFTASLSGQLRRPESTTGLVRLGVVGLVVNTWLPAFLATLRQAYPRLTLRIDASLTRLLLERLREGKLDLAIVAGPLDDPELHCEPLGQDQFVWMDAPRPGAPPPAPLTPAELAQRPVLTLSEDSYHHPIVRHWFRAGGVSLNPALSCNSMSLLGTLTAQGLGVSLLPRRGCRAELQAGRLVELPTTPALPPVPFFIVHHQARVPPLAGALAQMARAASDLPSDQPL
jgi:DNA-binding transcriptional LysR family regulator